MHSNASCRFNPRPATLQKSHVFSLLHEAHQASARFLPQGPYVFFLLLAGAHQNRCKHAPRLEPGPPSATAFFTPTTAQAIFSLCMLSHAPLAPAPASLRFWIATGTLLPTATLPRTSLHSHTWPRHRDCISPANEQSPHANSGYSAFPSSQPNNLFFALFSLHNGLPCRPKSKADNLQIFPIQVVRSAWPNVLFPALPGNEPAWPHAFAEAD